MQNQEWLTSVRQERAIAVIRTDSLEVGYQMAMAVAAGGMRLLEVTWNSDRPTALIEKLRTDLPGCVIGAGTLLNQIQMQEAIAAGAEFLFSPHGDCQLIRAALERGVTMIPGALTPTEIVTAWQAGAATVKVFPIQSVGGTHYLKQLQAPLTGIPLIPTGGVTIENARDFIEAGAIAVGLAGQLFPKEAIAAGHWAAVTQRAAALVARLKDVSQVSSR